MRPIWGLLALAAALLIPLPVQSAQEIVTLETRPGVTLKVLLRFPNNAPKAALVLFPGGQGEGHFSERNGQIRVGNNFLTRTSPLFVERRFAVAIIDAPSDQAGGMSDQFRTGKEHIQDIKKVIDLVDQKWPGPLYLVGTSRGTVSVAHLGAALQDPRISGIVLTSSIGASRPSRLDRLPLSLFDIPMDNITLPVLFVHHRNDGCWASNYADALRLRKRITKSPKVDFIEVQGGAPARSEPCEAMSPHGYLGKEREVVTAITDWIASKPVPNQIGPWPSVTSPATAVVRELNSTRRAWS